MTSGIETLTPWSTSGVLDSAQLGLDIAHPQDVDGDGLPDLLMSGELGDWDGEWRHGVTYIFHAPLSGPEAGAPSSDATLYAGFVEDAYDLCALGDIDGDAQGDLAIGGPWERVDGLGILYIARGPFVGPTDLTLATQTYTGDSLGAGLGTCAGPGDWDGDGLDDVVVSASEARGTGSTEGRGTVWLLRGPVAYDHLDDAEQILRGTDPHEFVGYDLGAVGDVNGDGLADFGVGNARDASGYASPDGVAVYLVTDRVDGIMHPRDVGATIRLGKEGASAASNIAARGVGDITGDGYDDVAFGAGWSADSAVMYVMAGPVADDVTLVDDATITLYSTGGARYDTQLSFAAGLGDWNSDGWNDLAVGDSRYTPPDVHDPDCAEGDCPFGAVYVLAGPIRPGFHDLGHEADCIEGSLVGGMFGAALSAGGDLDGDGSPDLAIGAPYADLGYENNGVAYVLSGGGTR